MDPNFLASLTTGKGGGGKSEGIDPAMLAGLLGSKGGKGGGKHDDGYEGSGSGRGGDSDSMGLEIWENPMVSSVAFIPSRKEAEYMDKTSGPIRDGLFEVSGGDKVSYRLYMPPEDVKIVVYFWHGNAETCTSVDHLQNFFRNCNAAVLSLDYRGYSWGTGRPSLTKLCGDAETCFSASLSLLEQAGCGTAKRVAMGRSIGATCAVHIAARRAAKIHGLVLDSGLMSVKGIPMVASLGPVVMGSPEAFHKLKEPFDTLGSLGAVSCPVLVMHGERDDIVPYSQAVDCHSRCPGQDKVLKIWERAGHNDVMIDYMQEWSTAVTELLGKASCFTEPFPAGALVEAHSLSTADLNGKQGCVLGPSGVRYLVEFPQLQGAKALMPANLKIIREEASEVATSDAQEFLIGATVEAHGLLNQAFNGARGKIVGPTGDRVSVEFPGPLGTKAFKPANLKLVHANQTFSGLAVLQVGASEFYAEYHGHKVHHLQALVHALRSSSQSLVWLAGDSSLDNKHWLFNGSNKLDPHHLADKALASDAIAGYQKFLDPPRMIRDVAFWLNAELTGRNLDMCCVNAAVEESTLADRRVALKGQDVVIRDYFQENDVLVTSIGGNDVALRPSMQTIASMQVLLSSLPGSENYNKAMAHFIDMYKTQTENYIKSLIVHSKPKGVVVCMLYYLDEKPGHGWCEQVLAQMGYNSNPALLQGLISQVYLQATCKVAIPGVRIIPLPLFEVLDGKCTMDYCQRVEPSVTGGEKMAKAIAGAIATL